MERKTDEFQFDSVARPKTGAGGGAPAESHRTERDPPAGRLPARPPPAAPGLSKIDHKLHRPYAI